MEAGLEGTWGMRGSPSGWEVWGWEVTSGPWLPAEEYSC